jgi:hypothetical protein
MRFMIIPCCIAIIGVPTNASVTVTTNHQQWQANVSAHTTIDFTDQPNFTTITTQYAQVGITFTDGNDFVQVTTSFPTDSHGLISTDGFAQLGTVHMSFALPTTSLAFHFIGGLQIELYNMGRIVYTSANYSAGFTPFVGLVSTIPFDAAIVRDYDDPTIAIDNIYFGPPIPAPGAMTLLGIGALALTAKRRR